MKDKDKLKKLVQIIGDLLKVEGNEWLMDEIMKTIGETSSVEEIAKHSVCLLYTSPSPRDRQKSRMPSSA